MFTQGGQMFPVLSQPAVQCEAVSELWSRLSIRSWEYPASGFTGHPAPVNNSKQWDTITITLVNTSKPSSQNQSKRWRGNSVFFEKAMDRSEAIYQNILRLFCKARILLGASLLRERAGGERQGLDNAVTASTGSPGQTRRPEPFCQLSAFK